MKLINKLTLGHLIVGLFVIGVALVGMETINNIDFAFSEISEQTLPVIEALEDVRAAGLNIGSSTSEFVFLRAESKSNLTGLDIEKENIILAIKRYDVAISQYEELVNKFFPDEKDLAENVKNSGKKLQNASNELITLKEHGASSEIVLEKWGEFEAAEQEFLKAINGVIAHKSEEIAQRKQFVENAIATSVKTILIAGLLTFTIAIVLGVRISKSISDPITKLKNAAVEVGKGKLDTRVDIKSRDEVGILAACFNQMAERLEQGIEDRKQTEEALRLSEEKYRMLIDHIQDGIFIIRDEKLQFFNEAFARIAGYTVEEMIGRDFRDFIAPEDRDFIANRYYRRQKGENIPSEYEFSVLRKDGARIIVSMGVGLITYGGGVATMGVLRDITERKRAEDVLRVSESKYRKLHESMMDGFVFVDMEGKIKEYNKLYQNMLGYGSEELASLTYTDITPEKWHSFEQKIVEAQILPRGYSEVYEKEYRKKDGTIFPVELRTFLIKNEKGENEGMWAIVRDITERKRAEEALKESEERYRRLADFSPYGIGIHSEGKFVLMNQAGARILGAANPEELIGIPVLQIIHPDYRELVKERIRMQEEGKAAPLIEEKLLRLDGTSVDVELTSIPFTYKGKPAMYGVFMDITERKLAVNGLKESEERYRRLVDFSPYGIAIHSEGKLVFVNQAGAKILGAANPEEVIGIPVLQIVHPDYHEIVKKRIRMQEEGKAAPLIEEKLLRIDGTSVDVEITSIPFIYKGKPAMYGVFLDITKRKRAEEALHKSRLLLSEAERIAHLGNWEWDMQTNALQWSDETYRILGYSPGEITPYYDTFLNAIHPDDREHVEKAVADAMSKKKPYSIEHRIVRKDGSVVAVHSQGEVTFDGSGNPIRMIGTMQDITEHKKAEEILLENERLAYANQAKSEFLAVMSHELRTPLNSVIGFSELMKLTEAGELNEKQRHYIDNIITSGKSLLSIINGILDLSSIEAGKMEFVIETFDIVKALNEITDIIKEKAAEHNIILKKELDPQLRFIEADRMKFVQILFNLLDNAVKFSKEEGGTVTIITKKVDDMAQISVSDTGIGIKEEDTGKLFTKFWQVDSGIRRKYGGAGLGLAITKQLVELHGGKIMVESKYGEGSTFTFLIPLIAKKGGENK